MIEAHDAIDPSIRVFDQSRIGPILDGDPRDLGDGPPVTALFVQNTNPMMIAPELERVHRGFARDDLFACVHEQFMTETAVVADIVLPATMFLEHDDMYQSGGHQHIILGPKIVEPPGECRSNHEVVCELAKRLGAEHEGFTMTPRELIDHTLRTSGWDGIDRLEAERWFDCQPDFDDSHYIDGFAHSDGKFRFSPDWAALAPRGFVSDELLAAMPRLPDHWEVIEEATEEMPYRLVTAPARHYLNSSFTESPTSIRRERRPERDDPPRGRDDARGPRRRSGAPRQRPRRPRHPRRTVRRGAARRGDRGEHLAQPRVRGGQGDQRADRRRCGGAGGRLRIPRQPDLDPGGVGSGSRPLASSTPSVDNDFVDEAGRRSRVASPGRKHREARRLVTHQGRSRERFLELTDEVLDTMLDTPSQHGSRPNHR